MVFIEFVASLVGQQTEEDGCYLSTGNAVLRTNGAVRIAYESIVVIAVRTGQYIIRNGNGGLVAAAAAAAGGFFRKGPYAVQRKVCGQLLLAGQNRTVILFQPLKEKVPFTPSFEPDTLAGTSATV